LTRETRQAMSATLLIIVFLAGILPLCWWIQTVCVPSSQWDFLLWPSPGYLYLRAFDYWWRFGVGASVFWSSFLTIFILASIALLTACFYLPLAWHEKGETEKRRPERNRRRQFRFGSTARQMANRWRLEYNPFYWLSSRDRSPSHVAKSAIGVLVLIWLSCYAGCYSSSGRTKDICFGIVMFLSYGIHQVLKALFAIEASRRLSEDRQSGALELLLVTPLPVSKILSGQRRALREAFRWPMILAAIVNLGMFVLMAGLNPVHMDDKDRVVFSEMFIGGGLMLVLDAVALSWVGMSMAVKKRGHHRAIYSTFARVMLPPWLAILLFIFLNIGGTNFNGSDMIVFVGLWLFGCVIVDLVQASIARAGLAGLFRERSLQSSIVIPRPVLAATPIQLRSSPGT
jgi:hypothetical protein